LSRFLRKPDLETLVAAVAALCLAVTLWQAYVRASIPFELNFGEGLVLGGAVRVLDGSTPYPAPSSFPYVFNTFGPIGYLLTATAIRVFGLSLFGPRLLVMLAGTIAVFAIAGLNRRLGSGWGIGLLVGVFFLSTPLARVWFPLLKVDYWAILLSLLGLFIFLTFPRLWFIVLIPFALAVLTKMTAIAAPIACVVELMLQRRSKQALMVLAAIGGVLLSCVLLTEGPLLHLYRTNPESYSILAALEMYTVGLVSSLLPLAVILYSVAMGLRWTPANRLGWLYLVACSVTALSAGNTGADANHMLEWSAAVCLVAGLALGRLIEHRDPLGRLFVFAFMVVVALWSLWAWPSSVAKIELKGCADAYAFVRSFPSDRVLSEDVSALSLAGKPVLVSDPFVMTQLGSSVSWSKGSMEQLATQGYFDLIVLGGEIDDYRHESGRWPPALLEVIRQHYRLVRRLNCPPCMGAAYVPKVPGGAKQ
jgi:hypothetical protein